MFRFFHNIGETHYKNIKKSIRSNRLETRPHGNNKRCPSHALSLSSTEYAVLFVLNNAEKHALHLPVICCCEMGGGSRRSSFGNNCVGGGESLIKPVFRNQGIAGPTSNCSPLQSPSGDLEGLSDSSVERLHQRCVLLHLHKSMAVTSSFHHPDEVHDRPLLAVSEGEHSHSEPRQPLRGREVGGSPRGTGAPPHRRDGEIVLHCLLRRLLQIGKSPLS